MKRKQSSIVHVCVALLVFAFASCEYDMVQTEVEEWVPGAGGVPTEEISFTNDVFPLFDAQGCAGCHPTAEGLDFSSASKAYSTLTKNDKALVAADPENDSELVAKLKEKHAGHTLSNSQLNLIEGWVDQGAADN